MSAALGGRGDRWEPWAAALALAWFAARAGFYALRIHPSIPPDEVAHLGLSLAFSGSWLPPADGPATYPFGLVTTVPTLYYVLMGKLVWLNGFGAPPLLAEKAKQGEIDAVLNFWPYAARLEAAGFKQLIGIEDVVSELGAKGEVAMVGYVFSEAWAKENLKAVEGFLRAAAKADELLATSNEAWEAIRPLMRAENEATFEALRRRYREGIPERSTAENEADAKVLYQFLRELGGEKLVGPGAELAPGTFWKGDNS